VGRKREHDESTAAALVDAAERIVQEDGLDALTVRRVATEVGTTTRAVYSLFGSKEGLVVALGRRAFEILGDGLAALPETDDPAADLVEAGVTVFRRFAIAHPSLFRIAIQWAPAPEVVAAFRGTGFEALTELKTRVERLEPGGLLGGRSVWSAVAQFHALCEGLAAVELRGQLPLYPRAPDGLPADGVVEEQIWRDALSALVHGFAARA
jgi:AcrR family transcriptional regulator